MIGHVTLGTNDLWHAAGFCNALARDLGTARMMESERFIACGEPAGAAGTGLTRPHDGNSATVGNGVMVALAAKDPGQVDRLHRLALEHAGTDKGAPGPRDGLHAAYLRDRDGNKLNAFVMLAEPA